MKVVSLLESRRAQWRELEALCTALEGGTRGKPGSSVIRLATLYRAACADLALADAYQLPPNTVGFLHQLVARAHNQLYRTRRVDWRTWTNELLYNVPRRLYADWYLRLAFLLFWGLFILAMIIARNSTEFSEKLLGQDQLDSMRSNFSQPLDGRGFDGDSIMFGFYIMHNAGIGLECFAWGLLYGIGGIFKTVYNAAVLGASFGYMSARPVPNATTFSSSSPRTGRSS
ncbi:MAG: stage II sporulation protein M [Pirellulales bacterium]